MSDVSGEIQSVVLDPAEAAAVTEEKPARRRQRTVTVPAGLIVQEEREREPPDTPTGLVRLAVQQGLDIDRLRELMALQREWEEREAEKAFFDALSKFQSEIPPIVRTNTADAGRAGKRRYASLGTINEAIRPWLYANGLSFRFRQQQTPAGITVTCVVSHRDGHSEETTLTAGADSSGAKNAIQSVGSTITYLERYTLTAALGLTTIDEDDDGEAAGPEVTPEQQRQNALDLARAAAAGNQPAQETPREPAGEQRTANQQAAPPAQAQARVMIRPEQFREMMGLMKELFTTGAAAQEWLLNGAGTNNPQELLATEADGVLSALLKLKHERNTPAPLPPAPAEPEGDHITDQQRAAIRDLTTQLYGDGAGDAQAAWLGTLGYGSVRSCTRLQAAERISALDAKAHPKADGGDIPF